jgi:hypothetical protein
MREGDSEAEVPEAGMVGRWRGGYHGIPGGHAAAVSLVGLHFLSAVHAAPNMLQAGLLLDSQSATR